MNADDFALRVVAALKQQRQPETFSDVYAWREGWWWAWLGYIEERRVEFEASIIALREQSAQFQQRLDANTDYVTVRPSLEHHIERNRPVLRFWKLLADYLDADTESARRIAGELAQHANATPTADWNIGFFHVIREPWEGEYWRVYKADRWRAFDHDRNAGAFAVRMQRIADVGSPTPLDRAEAEIMLLKELRFRHVCTTHRYQGHWHRGTYQYLHHVLHAEKYIALINVFVQIYDAEQIGDTAGADAGHAAFEAADAMFGGNFRDGRTVWQHELTDAEREAWERWKAETDWQEWQPHRTPANSSVQKPRYSAITTLITSNF